MVKTTLPVQETSGSGSGQANNSSGSPNGVREDGRGSDSGNRQSPTSVSGSEPGVDREDLKNFLAKAIKEEVAMAMTSFIQSQIQRRKERSGMDYLEALLGGQWPLYIV